MSRHATFNARQPDPTICNACDEPYIAPAMIGEPYDHMLDELCPPCVERYREHNPHRCTTCGASFACQQTGGKPSDYWFCPDHRKAKT